MAKLLPFLSRKYRIGSNVVCIRKMEREDIPGVARLYQSVAVTNENYLDRFDINSEGSFERKGGLFRPQTKSELEEKVESKQEIFLIAEDEQKNLCGYIWHGINQANAKRVRSIYYYPEAVDKQQEIERAIKNHTLIFGGEIMTETDGIPGIAGLLFHVMNGFCLQCGYKFCVGEVYSLKHALDKEGREWQLDMMNQRSYRVLCHTGGIKVGEFPEIVYNKPEFTVRVVPYCVIYRFLDSSTLIADYMQKHDIKEIT